ncbi:family with sequence similarity 229 member A, partial [Homo sapiens]
FPIEAGDSRGLAAAPESQDSPEAVATEHNPVSGPCRASISPGRFVAALDATA